MNDEGVNDNVPARGGDVEGRVANQKRILT